jgi:hypothetical protein
MVVPNVCLPAVAWLEAAAALEKCELWAQCLMPDGDEGAVRAGLERLCREAWQQLGDVMPIAIQLADRESSSGGSAGKGSDASNPSVTTLL